LVLLHVLVGYLLFDLVRRKYQSTDYIVTSPTEPEERHTPEPPSTPFATPEASPSQPELTTSPVSGRPMMIPVAGITADQLVDTFTASRANGRDHDAIDIMAPAGTPVLAAVKGQIVKFFDSVPGGITIYQASEDKRFMYYYAHLQRRADGLTEGTVVEQGTVIGYVGDTGNAGAGNYHLHFSIARVADPKRYWEGSYLNPFPYLKSGTLPN
jgi:murein DD-endopeptidase MepM/ murein hydrolase activator NlpD